jgi:hypothetical protein
MFTGPLPINGCPFIVVRVCFTGMCLSTRCLAMGIHVRINWRSTLTVILSIYGAAKYSLSVVSYKYLQEKLFTRDFLNICCILYFFSIKSYDVITVLWDRRALRVYRNLYSVHNLFILLLILLNYFCRCDENKINLRSSNILVIRHKRVLVSKHCILIDIWIHGVTEFDKDLSVYC